MPRDKISPTTDTHWRKNLAKAIKKSRPYAPVLPRDQGYRQHDRTRTFVVDRSCVADVGSRPSQMATRAGQQSGPAVSLPPCRLSRTPTCRPLPASNAARRVRRIRHHRWHRRRYRQRPDWVEPMARLSWGWGGRRTRCHATLSTGARQSVRRHAQTEHVLPTTSPLVYFAASNNYF